MGIVGEKSAEATWLSLMGSHRHIGPEGGNRFAAQSSILAVGLGIVMGTYEWLAKDYQHDRIVFSITWTLFSQSSSIMGFRYEKLELVLCSGQKRTASQNSFMVISWLFVQLTIFGMANRLLDPGTVCFLSISTLGRGKCTFLPPRYGGLLLYVNILTPLVWFGAIHEFILN